MTPTLTHHTMTTANGQTEPMIPAAAVIEKIKFETNDTATYTITFSDPEIRRRYQFLPGQFNMIYLPGIGEAAISVSSDPGRPDRLLHTIREAGNVTGALAQLKRGSTIGVRGPYGSAWPVDQAEGQDLIIVGGGIGLAPLRPVIHHVMRHRPKYNKVTVLTGARTPEELLFPAEHDIWSGHDIEVIVTVDRADKSWRGNVGVVPMMFYNLRPDPRRTVVFTCGPEIMMHFVVYEALARRVPRERIFVSLERNMKCAIGFCGHCQLGPLFLCKEGPVFSYNRIEPFITVEEF